MVEGDEGGKACGCTCICDPTVARVLDQTSSRYNDRSAFANNSAQDQFNNMNSMFLAQAQNALEQTPRTQNLGDITQLLSILKTLKE
jgi:hypothetical protein